MTEQAPGADRVLGTLRLTDGTAIVRMQDRFDTDIDDLWSALTEPARLARWIGEIEGDLRPGGEFRARYFASGWEGTGRIDVCEPPRRLLLTTQELHEEGEQQIEATLTADGDHTVLVVEQRGMPPEQLAGYGAGIQIHVEDLAAYLSGHEVCDASRRWQQLSPLYEPLAARLGC